MSLAQRRTAPEGIDTLPGYNTQDNRTGNISGDSTIDDDRRDSDSTLHSARNDQIWQTISYDPFAQKPLQHYESFPPEITDNKAAYEVSTAKRAGKP